MGKTDQKFVMFALLALAIYSACSSSTTEKKGGNGTATQDVVQDTADTGSDTVIDDTVRETDGALDDGMTESDSQSDDISENTDTNSETSSEETSSSGCGTDHEKVGWAAELSTKQHNVSGTAVIVDNCTIDIRNFTYDGQGPAAAVYGAKNGNWADGFKISSDLTKKYTGETLTITLPEDKSLDDLDGVSIWCYEFDVDFGSGMFEPESG